MKRIVECIKERRSVRTFDGRGVEPETMEQLKAFLDEVKNPYGIPVEFRFLNAKEHGLTCPVMVGSDLYVAGKVDISPEGSVAFGYAFEAFVLYAQSLGLGTVWLGGTMNRPAFEKAMELKAGEMMPCTSPIGYPAAKMSVRESLMRKGVKADERMHFGEVFFDGTFSNPLTVEAAGDLALPLEMVRLAPSAVNKQPWRIVVEGNDVHFYLKRSKGLKAGEKLDMQMVDMGIALCHFELTAKELGMNVEFLRQEKPNTGDLEYIATYRVS